MHRSINSVYRKMCQNPDLSQAEIIELAKAEEQELWELTTYVNSFRCDIERLAKMLPSICNCIGGYLTERVAEDDVVTIECELCSLVNNLVENLKDE